MARSIFALIMVLQGWSSLFAQSRADSIRLSNNKTVQGSQMGIASYYNSGFQGRKTASGEKYDEKKMTAAHNRLPMGSWIKVTHLSNKRWVIVRVNDRLHYRNKRIVDLSRAAASKLGYVNKGVARVKVQVLKNYRPPVPVKLRP